MISINKIYFIMFASILVIVSCKENAVDKINEANLEASQKELENNKFPVMKFDNTEHDFGIITEGDHVETVFKFKNTGNAELVIVNAQASCGCTVPEFTKAPIKPGDSGEIKVKFDSQGKPGIQQKQVTITANTLSGTENVTIKAMVNPKNK